MLDEIQLPYKKESNEARQSIRDAPPPRKKSEVHPNKLY